MAVQCDRSSIATVVKGSVAKGMEEPSFCNLSLAVDCTLSLGSITSRTDIPSRLSRAGSPDQDLDWSLSVRSEHEVPTQREQDLSWGGSCNRTDSEHSPEFYPQVDFLFEFMTIDRVCGILGAMFSKIFFSTCAGVPTSCER